MELTLKILGGFILGYTNIRLIGLAISSNKKTDCGMIALSMAYSLLVLVNYTLFFGTVRLIIGLLVLVVIFKVTYELNYYKSFIVALVSYMMAAIGEVMLILVIMVTPSINHETFIPKFVGTLQSNILMSLIIFCIYMLLSTRIKHVIEWCSIKEDKIIIITSTIFILVIGYYFFATLKIDWTLSTLSVICIATIFSFCCLLFAALNGRASTLKLETEYDKVLSYMKNGENLIEEYQLFNHEYINQLSVIKNMQKKDQRNYIDSIIGENSNHQNQWINKLRYVPGGGLKGLLHYKIVIMKRNEINVAISISRDLQGVIWDKKIYNDICKIVGIYLDNAIDVTKNLLEKEIVVEMYRNYDIDVISISNNFTTNIDIEKMYNRDYSTKGSHHGIGLYLVSIIVNRNERIKKRTTINNGFISQEIYIER